MNISRPAMMRFCVPCTEETSTAAGLVACLRRRGFIVDSLVSWLIGKWADLPESCPPRDQVAVILHGRAFRRKARTTEKITRLAGKKGLLGPDPLLLFRLCCCWESDRREVNVERVCSRLVPMNLRIVLPAGFKMMMIVLRDRRLFIPFFDHARGRLPWSRSTNFLFAAGSG